MSRHLGVGRRGEDLAADYLQRRGFKVLERNYRTKFGEVDLICLNRETVVFVEVKSRSSGAFGAPDEAVHRDKRRRLSKAALDYLARRSWENRRARFDVVSIRLDGPEPEVRHLEDALDLILDQAG